MGELCCLSGNMAQLPKSCKGNSFLLPSLPMNVITITQDTTKGRSIQCNRLFLFSTFKVWFL